MTWTPPQIQPVCENTAANLTQCSAIGYAYLALLVHLFGKSEDDPKADKHEAKINVETNKFNNENPRNRKSNKDTYDFIIVGAGSAGCVLANRLSEVKHWKILLLEAGGEEPNVTSIPAVPPVLGASSIDWGYRTQPDNSTCLSQLGQQCPTFRGKTMGGSSAINYLVYMRGNRADYDTWAEKGNVGWSYKEVLPYFEKSITVKDSLATENHGHDGYLSVERFSYIDDPSKLIVEAFNEKGLPKLDLGLESRYGVNINLATAMEGKRQSVNAAFIRPIRHKRPNLKIITNALATKIIIDSKKATRGVKYFKNGKFYEVYAVKEVLISAGSINSPKLLKLSGIGPKDELESHNIPVISNLKVGYNLQDHVTTDALIFTFSNKLSTLVSGNKLLEEIQNYYNQPQDKSGPLASTNTLNSIAFINTEDKSLPPNIQYHFDGRNVKDFYSDPPSYLGTNIFPLSFYDGIAARPVLLKPKSRGYIALNRTDPVFGSPLIYQQFFQVKEDLDTLLEATRFVVSLEETEIFKSVGAEFIKTPVPGCAQFEWGTDDYFRCLYTNYTATIYHPAGTCKMGPKTDKDVVVSPRFKVHGIRKLRVIDSSTMPEIVRGNLNAPTVMMAEKGSDMIKREHHKIYKAT